MYKLHRRKLASVKSDESGYGDTEFYFDQSGNSILARASRIAACGPISDW